MGVEPSGFSFAAEGPSTELPPTQVRHPSSPMRPSLVDPRFGPRVVARPNAGAGTTPLEQDPLRLVFPILKRPGTAFDHISVGRTASMDVVLPLLQVSKFHAYFTRDAAGTYTLADAGSKNGTWIGARRLPVRTPETVRDGDRIRLGMYTFTFLTQAGFLDLVKSRAVHWVESAARPAETGVRRSP
jgi:pSer/pThr/pTyr-binding forkhead associated (FHA) protein